MIHLIKRLKKWLDIKSPSKDMMRGWTREDVDAIIEEMEEWEATDYFDHIFDRNEVLKKEE